MLLVCLIAASLALAGCQPPIAPLRDDASTAVPEPLAAPTTVVVPAVVESATLPVEPAAASTSQGVEKVTLNINLATEPPTLDPSLAADVLSIDIVKNLFLGLTTLNSDGNVEPELATEWSVSGDRLTYTFKMRDDASWVGYIPSQGVQKLGPVTAYDVVYGVRRTCDPRTGSSYAYVDYIIAGCQALNNADLSGLSEEAIQALVDGVGVTAPNSTTVQFTVATPAAYFPAIAGMWVNRPQHRATIEEYGDRWTEPAAIVTNGPYVLVDWFHDDSMVLEKNPFWIGWDAVDGNVERIEMAMVKEPSTAFANYETGYLDTVDVPLADIDRVMSDPVLSKEHYRVPAACTNYVGFTNSKPPLDNVLVRRALSAAIDRQSLIDHVLKGGEIPANTFAPATIFGSAAGDTGIAPWALPESMGGWGYDKALAQARQWLAEAGYPDGQGFPRITFLHTTNEDLSHIAQALQAMWKDGLGIEVDIQTQEYKVLLDALQPSNPPEERPHTWLMGWCADYADENNWLHEVFNSDEGANWLSWDKDANAPLGPEGKSFNQLTKAAQQAEDPQQRQALYRAAEKILADDAAGFAPLYYTVNNGVTKPYLQRTYPSIGGAEWYKWVLDWDAKQKALGR